MWIVRLALRRPHTFVVISLLIFLLSIGTAVEAPRISIPTSTSLSLLLCGATAACHHRRWKAALFPSPSAPSAPRSTTSTTRNRRATRALPWYALLPATVKVELAMSQITAVVPKTILRVLPPGTFPPNILKYDAPACLSSS